MAEERKDTFTWADKKAALARQLRPYKNRLVILAAVGLFSAVANGIIPLITGRFFDALIAPHDFTIPILGAYPAWAVLLSAWFLIQITANILSYASDLRERFLATELEAGVQSRSFAYLLTLPISFHKKRRTGEVIESLGRAAWMLQSMAQNILRVTPQLLSIIIGVGISFAIYPPLALILVAGIILYLFVLLSILPKTAAYQDEGVRIWNRSFGDAQDAYANVSTVKQAGMEKLEGQKIVTTFIETVVPLWFKMERAWGNMNFAQRLIVLSCQGAILLYSVFLVAAQTISVGDLIAFNAYAGMIIGPFVSLGHQWQTMQNGLIALARLDTMLKTPPEPYEPADAVTLADVRGEVTFEDVHFAYEPDQPEVLKGVSFSARPGEVVALVGETGVGKSTVTDLVSGYYFATQGSIRIDGHDIRAVSLHDLRRRIAVVPQEVVLFNATIADNIRYGRPDATDTEVQEAARRAHADAFIERFPQRYGQEVGERGVKLSVGQKQRVAIARAMLREPRILILDEPTSALDSETEQYITKSLEELMRGRTTFIVAHRLSTVRKAHRIVVLEDGRIAEQGTHDELLEKEGRYARLYHLHIGLHE